MIESECRSFFSSRDEVDCVPVCFRTHIETKTCVNCGLEYYSYVVDDEGKAVFVTMINDFFFCSTKLKFILFFLCVKEILSFHIYFLSY